LESEPSTQSTEEALFQAGGQTPIVFGGNHSPTNSVGSAGSTGSGSGENHIVFYNVDALLNTSGNNALNRKDSTDSLLFGKTTTNNCNSLGTFKNSLGLGDSHIIFRNSLENKIA